MDFSSWEPIFSYYSHQSQCPVENDHEVTHIGIGVTADHTYGMESDSSTGTFEIIGPTLETKPLYLVKA